MSSVRRGMHAELISIPVPAVRERYRTLVKLVYDIGYHGAGRGHRERHIFDISNYASYVGYSLEAVIDGRQVPAHAAPPVLDRDDPNPWRPPFAVPYWDDPTDDV